MRVLEPVLDVSMSGAISAVTFTVDSCVAVSLSSKSTFSMAPSAIRTFGVCTAR